MLVYTLAIANVYETCSPASVDGNAFLIAMSRLPP